MFYANHDKGENIGDIFYSNNHRRRFIKVEIKTRFNAFKLLYICLYNMLF